jgi:hypothetical protein
VTESREEAEQVDADEPELAPFDFNLLVLSLNASALMHLGEDPAQTDAALVDLGLARQTIDMLAVLETKTRGNLTGEEERLLHDVLFDLRMRFARKSQKPGK